MKTGIRQEATGNSKKAKVTGFAGFALCAMLIALCGSVEAQQPTKVSRIGYLSATSFSAIAGRTEAFRQGLRELGYVEGRNIVIEWRSVGGNADRLPGLATELDLK